MKKQVLFPVQIKHQHYKLLPETRSSLAKLVLVHAQLIERLVFHQYLGKSYPCAVRGLDKVFIYNLATVDGNLLQTPLLMHKASSKIKNLIWKLKQVVLSVKN